MVEKRGRRAVMRLLAGCSVAAASSLLVPRAMGAQAKTKSAPRRHIVILDPGHGGIDPGATGLSGIYEKEIVLDTAKLLARELEASKRYTVVLTRTGDEFIPLHERVARGRAAEGELFLSIHAD